MRSIRMPLAIAGVMTTLGLLSARTQAATLNVPAQYSTIQAAITAATAGDTIVVAAGTYREAFVWASKDLTIQGAGAGLSVIDPSSLNTGAGIRGLYTHGLTSASRIAGFTFQGAAAGQYNGGAMYNDWSSPTVANCTFSGNSAFAGGGLYNFLSSPTVTNCTFTGNSANYGGAMYNYAGLSTPTLTDCTFSGNYAYYGGGMYNNGGDPVLSNCTLSGNSATYIGGGMYSNYYSYTALTNCVVWGNSASVGGGIHTDGAAPAVSCSDIQGFFNATPDANGNFSADPLFVRNPSPATGDYGDLRLQASSPCIDAGNNAAVPAGITTDLAGNQRIVDGDLNGTATVDMGAFEFQPVLLVAEGEAQAIIDQVKAMVDGGALLPAGGQPLYAKLDAAIAALQAGDTATATVKLQDFINQVNAFVKTGRLTAAQGQALTVAANAILGQF